MDPTQTVQRMTESEHVGCVRGNPREPAKGTCFAEEGGEGGRRSDLTFFFLDRESFALFAGESCAVLR